MSETLIDQSMIDGLEASIVNLQAQIDAKVDSSSKRKNYFINGNFDVWQQGTEFTAAGQTYTTARWEKNDTGTSVVAVDRIDDPFLEQDYQVRYRVTTAGGAGNTARFAQRIENVKTLQDEEVTISLRGMGVTGDGVVTFYIVQNFGTGGDAPVNTNAGTITLSANPTLTTQSITFTLKSIAGKTINDADSFLEVQFRLDAEQIQDARLYQAQIEKGSEFTGFEIVTPADNLARCQRYYQFISGTYYVPVGFNSTTNLTRRCSWPLPVTMRASPTITTAGDNGWGAPPDVTGAENKLTVTGTAATATSSTSINTPRFDAEL